MLLKVMVVYFKRVEQYFSVEISAKSSFLFIPTSQLNRFTSNRINAFLFWFVLMFFSFDIFFYWFDNWLHISWGRPNIFCFSLYIIITLVILSTFFFNIWGVSWGFFTALLLFDCWGFLRFRRTSGYLRRSPRCHRRLLPRASTVIIWILIRKMALHFL